MCDPTTIGDLVAKMPFALRAIHEGGKSPCGSFHRELARRAVSQIESELALVAAYVAANGDMSVEAARRLIAGPDEAAKEPRP
jgi:hypothetical protein